MKSELIKKKVRHQLISYNTDNQLCFSYCVLSLLFPEFSSLQDVYRDEALKVQEAVGLSKHQMVSFSDIPKIPTPVLLTYRVFLAQNICVSTVTLPIAVTQDTDVRDTVMCVFLQTVLQIILKRSNVTIAIDSVIPCFVMMSTRCWLIKKI